MKKKQGIKRSAASQEPTGNDQSTPSSAMRAHRASATDDQGKQEKTRTHNLYLSTYVSLVSTLIILFSLSLSLVISVPVTVLHPDSNKGRTPRRLLPRQKPVPSPTMTPSQQHPLTESTRRVSTSTRGRKRNAGKEPPVVIQGSESVTSTSPPSSKSRGMKRSKLDIENIKVRVWIVTRVHSYC